MIALPPLFVGGVYDTFTAPVANVVDADLVITAVGAPGRFATATWFDGPESAPVPLLLLAATVQV